MEDVMEELFLMFGISAPAAVAEVPVLNQDNNGIFVCLFIGFCALIVVAQEIPSVLLLTGIVKGHASKMKGETATAKK
jgi:hypothetical protein